MYKVDLRIIIKKLRYMQKVMKHHHVSTWDFFFSIINKRYNTIRCNTDVDIVYEKGVFLKLPTNKNSTYMSFDNYSIEIIVYENTFDFYIIDKQFFLSELEEKDQYFTNFLQNLIMKKEVDNAEMDLLNFEFNLIMKKYEV